MITPSEDTKRKALIERYIQDGNTEMLIQLCYNPAFDKLVRNTVSYAALKHGKIVRLKDDSK